MLPAHREHDLGTRSFNEPARQKINRTLVLSLPSGGVLDENVPEGSLLVLRNRSMERTTETPTGFWKRLHEVLLQRGLKPIPLEAAAYYVDDILWLGMSRWTMS